MPYTGEGFHKLKLSYRSRRSQDIQAHPQTPLLVMQTIAGLGGTDSLIVRMVGGVGHVNEGALALYRTKIDHANTARE